MPKKRLRHGEIDTNWEGHEVRSRKALVRAKCRGRTEAEEATAMKNAEKNYRRDRKREAARQAKTVRLDDLLDEPASPVDRTIEVYEEIQRLLWLVTPAQRQALEEVFLAERAHAEAARLLGIPKHTLRTRIAAAKARIQRL